MNATTTAFPSNPYFIYQIRFIPPNESIKIRLFVTQVCDWLDGAMKLSKFGKYFRTSAASIRPCVGRGSQAESVARNKSFPDEFHFFELNP
jgi:hypothetical protein